MKLTHTTISLISSFLTLVTLQSWGQDLPSACGGSRVRYGVSGLPASVFDWEVTGGTVLNNYNDSIDVEWEEAEGIKTIKVTEHTKDLCVATPQIAHVMVGAPNIGLANQAEICQGGSYTFEPSPSFATYQWSNGATGSTLTVSQAGIYWVEVSDGKGCKGRDSIELVVNQGPVVDLGKDTSLCPEESLTLDAGIGGTNYVWSTGDISQTIEVNYSTPKAIWASVTNDKGCTTTDTIQVNACNMAEWIKKFKVPNAFTPNGDNDNDTWRLEWIQYFQGATVEIFDRWGRRVFQSNNFPSEGWDGHSNGKPLPMDAYYYIIDLKNGLDPIVGNVTLIR